MTIHSHSRPARDQADLHRDGFAQQVSNGVAMAVLALITGVSLRSARNILPTAGEAATPYLGI